MIKLFVFMIFTFLQLTKQFFLIIDANTAYCVSKLMSPNENFSGSYLISGENEESCKISIENEQKLTLWEVYGQKNGSFNMPIVTEGTYFLCVQNTFSKQIAFSFDFLNPSEEKIISIGTISL